MSRAFFLSNPTDLRRSALSLAEGGREGASDRRCLDGRAICCRWQREGGRVPATGVAWIARPRAVAGRGREGGREGVSCCRWHDRVLLLAEGGRESASDRSRFVLAWRSNLQQTWLARACSYKHSRRKEAQVGRQLH